MPDDTACNHWPWDDDDDDNRFDKREIKLLKAIYEIVKHLAAPTTDVTKLQEVHDSLEAAAKRLGDLK